MTRHPRSTPTHGPIARACSRVISPNLIAFVMLMSMGCGCDPDPPVSSEGTFFVPQGIGTYEALREPRLRAPDRIDFGMLERGEQSIVQIEVANDGRAPLTIQSWRMTDPNFTLRFPNFMDGTRPSVLEPGEVIVAEIIYTARDTSGTRGELIIESDDPKSGVWVVDLLANLVEPCLAISDEVVDFGSVSPGGNRTLGVTLSNCSDGAVTRVAYSPRLTTDDTHFWVIDQEDLRDVALEPGEEREVLIEFSPPAPGEYRDQIVFRSDVDGGRDHEVLLLGEGSPFACPTPVIEATNQNGVTTIADPTAQYIGLPLDTLEFDSSRSTAEGGASIEHVEWTLIKRPEDSAARFAMNQSAQTNALFLDLSGDYVVEMHVWDSRGTRSCEPALMNLRATPDEDIHIQLVWDTPNDSQQLDSLGSDVDLHLLRAGGIWNARPWDCHWQNLEPDWGQRDDPADDPSLDIDDINGWGPENINLNNPQGERRYHVGVHYFSDQGYGPSYATVRVYLGGVLARELRRKRLTDQQFWHVVDIDWQSRQITEYDDAYLTFPEGVFPPE